MTLTSMTPTSVATVPGHHHWQLFADSAHACAKCGNSSPVERENAR